MSTSPSQVAPAPKAPSSGQGCVLTALIASVVSAGVSLLVSLGVVLVILPVTSGSMSMPGQLAIEEDSVDVPLIGNTFKGEVTVFYRKPFSSPPKLTFPAGMSGCYIKEQKADCFSLARDVTGHAGWSTIEHVQWKAEGDR
jgi:hypothetical protein